MDHHNSLYFMLDDFLRAVEIFYDCDFAPNALQVHTFIILSFSFAYLASIVLFEISNASDNELEKKNKTPKITESEQVPCELRRDSFEQ